MTSQTPAIALDPDANYEAAEVALWLRVAPATFARNRKKYFADGFPRPISRWGRKVWSGAALIAWRGRPQDIESAGANVLPLRAHLAERARDAAAGGRRRHP